MNTLARHVDPLVRRSIEDEIEPWLAGGIEVVGTDDREEDDCDDEDAHDAEPDSSDGETVTWENDVPSQEVLVSL